MDYQFAHLQQSTLYVQGQQGTKEGKKHKQ